MPEDLDTATEEVAQPYGPRFEDLPEDLVNAIKAAVKEAAGQEQYIRRREVLRDRQSRFYERGYQHIYEGRNGIFIQGAPGESIAASGRQIDCPSYIDDYNIFQPFERVIESILTQNPPGIDFQPDNPSLSEDMEAAETAEGYRKLFDRANDVKAIQTEMVRMFCMSARTVAWTRTKENAQKWGRNADGSAKQMEVTTIHGTLESRVPITAKSQDDCLYLWLFDDPDVKQAKTEYKHVAKQIKPGMSGIGESQYERTARLGTLQGSRSQAQMGDAFSHLVTRMHCWFRPAAFTGEAYDDPFSRDSEKTVGEAIQDLFPDGVHAVFCGDVYCEASAESMDDHLTIGFPYKGDGMYRMAIMDPMVVVQDRFNDNMNVAAQIFDEGWPSTWINADDQDYDGIQEQIADPYSIRLKKIKTLTGKMEDDFFREPNPELPATFLEWNDFLQGALPQFQLACPPAIFGEAMQDQKTASGYAQAKAQAMGQQAIWFGVIQWMWSRIYYQAALCAAANPDHAQDIVIPGENGTATINLQKLTKGKFGAYADEDSDFPESTLQKRATLGTIWDRAAASPEVGAALLASPDNWKTFCTINGIPELVIPQAIARDKQIFEIELLLQQSPIPPDPQAVDQALVQHAADSVTAEHTGMPAPPDPDPMALMQSSVPVQELDFHQWEFAKCQEWLSGPERRTEEAKGNAAGVQNVILHALEHQKYMVMQASAMAAAAPQPAKPEPASDTV